MSSDQHTQFSVEQCAEHIRSSGIIAIVRGSFKLHHLLQIAESLLAGGIDIIEVTLNTSDALEGIRALRRNMDDHILVGAGTARTVNDINRAYDAGAQFTVSPNLDLASVRCSQDRGLLHLPGVFTASEAQAAFTLGCRMVKLFPAHLLGPAYLKALRAPLDDIEFVPTGGIDSDNLAGYVQAGAVAVGVGSALVTSPDQDPADVTQRAAGLVSVLREARRNSGD